MRDLFECVIISQGLKIWRCKYLSQKNSHIQMPKLILKNFHNEKKELYYYDFLEQKIKKGHAKTFYAEQGYYSDYVETYLDKKVESRLGVLVNFFKKTNFQYGDNPPIDYEDVAYTYLYSLMFRAPEFVEEMKKDSCFFSILSVVDQRDIAVHDALIMAKERHILGEYKVAFLLNNTTEQFVLPTGGIVQYGRRLVCPISPWRGLVFDKNITAQNEQEIRLFEVTTDDEINHINIEAVRQEKLRNKKHIVASKAEILIDLL